MDTNDAKHEKRPGEKQPGKFHYNPGNMSGKSAETCKDFCKGEKDVDQAEVITERRRK